MKTTAVSTLSMDIFKKLEILSNAANYDVACTSSGVQRNGQNGSMGNAVAGGICHSFGADGRCISLLKILYTNECVYDCKYCVNRISNDIPRATFTPEEIAELTISFYRRNYIEGLFLSSGINKNPNHTMEQIYEALYIIRHRYHFNGYIHIKSIPNTDPVLIEKIGWLADRMSANLELPTADGLKKLAPQKSRKSILTPMKQVQLTRKKDLNFHGVPESQHMIPQNVPALDIAARQPLPDNTGENCLASVRGSHNALAANKQPPGTRMETTPSDTAALAELKMLRSSNSRFVPAGQSTQMIIGATEETDYEIVHVAESLYQNFDLKRVFYSAFINTTGDPLLPLTPDGPHMLREHRLYQADFLLRFYQFKANEIITADHPNLNVRLDPKCNWAMNHLEQFPIEVQSANYHTLLRIPGVGVKSAKRILAARRTAKLQFSDLKKMGIVLKRAMYFITCNGSTMLPLKMSPGFILTNLLGLREKLPDFISGEPVYQQLSLLDDPKIGGEFIV